ncbi:serine hydrolase domain-containing protein [Spirillospora sp. CA-294931]|uniref:serine hydrolase domain-containing protein n=1 Tax=Spirillospora sp. CA-294931 TaxID=3240042 RepID=UPI003D927476
MSGSVQGHCDPAFSAVREAFERNFAEERELGAAVTVYAGDRKVVDLWGGVADHRTGREWTESTPAFGFSCTKAVTATAALLLAERGAYDMDGPVTAWWPEFGAEGKEGATAAHLLSHQAGLPAFARSITAEEAADHAARAAELAGQPPEWTPGEAHGYHALTFGWLAGEIVRRLSGRTVGAFVRDEFTAGLDLWIGAPDDVIARAAKLTAGHRLKVKQDPGAGALSQLDPETADRLAASYLDPQSPLNRSTNNPHPGKGGYNNPVVLRAGWPGAGMTTTSSALAGFYRDLVAGRILRPDTLREATKPRVSGPDRTLVVESSFGLGYMLPASLFRSLRAARGSAFGHAGAGGSVGFGDTEAGLAMAYLPNLMGVSVGGDPRASSLAEAAYASLG